MDKSIMIRLPEDLYERLKKLAASDERGIATEARRAIRAGLPVIEREAQIVEEAKRAHGLDPSADAPSDATGDD